MLSPSLSRQHLGLLLGFIGMAIFGGTLPATRIAVLAINPMALTALRTAIAGLCSLALLIVLRRPLPPRRLWPQLAIAMLCVSILFPLLMAFAVQTVDASHGAWCWGFSRSPRRWSLSSLPTNGRNRCSGSLPSPARRW
jgi:drug/metabolite transporter (DMT)-like permease